jgi:NosR/NirI family nitrous oxide reductase transcriptional regulator
MDCQILYYDDHACPPLAHERKASEKAGMPLTPIGGDGYFIPVEKIGGRKSPTAGAPEA